MGLRPITINTPRDQEPHLFSQDDACIYESIFGEDCVFDIGSKFKAQTLSNNKIRLSDGVLQNGGHVARIMSGDYEDVTIANGTSGKKRADIIVCKFTTNGKVDNMEIVVKQGVAGSTYSDPALTLNNLYTGGQVREMPLYRVKIDGLSIVAVEQMFKLRENIEEMQNSIFSMAQIIQHQFSSLQWTNPRYSIKEKNGIVYINYYVIVSGGIGITEYNIATIPNEIAPKQEIRSQAWSANNTGKRSASSITITPSGILKFISSENFVEAGFTVSYMK